jgi:aryl-alcohol dehydrogenase-like predicted oxidoreductase
MLTRDPAKASETERSQSDTFGKGLYPRQDDLTIATKVTQIARARSIPNAQVALAWMLGKETITAPIIGATRLSHLEDAAAALDVHLSEDEVHQLEETYQPHQVAGFS